MNTRDACARVNRLIVLLIVAAVFNQACYARTWTSTIGQLTKRAQSVVVGTVDEIEATDEGIISFRLKRARSILGSAMPPDASFELAPTTHMRLSVGDKVIMFASSKQIDPTNFESFRFDYFEQIPDDEPRYVMSGQRGLIAADGKILSEVTDVVAGYWQMLRGESRNPFSYAEFLIDLMAGESVDIDHETSRIREDAELDLRILIRFSDIPTNQRLLRETTIPDHIRAYAESIMQWKRKGEPRTATEWKPTDDDWNRLAAMLESESRADKLAALAELSQLDHREAVLEFVERWQEQVVALLDSPEEDVRVWAAVLLSYASDDRVLMPLVRGLQSDVLYRRRAAWDALERISEGAVPDFDANAPTEVRQQAIDRIKEWSRSTPWRAE